MEGMKLYLRICVIALLTLLASAAVVAALYAAASVPGGVTADKRNADRRYYSTETVTAARGEILDRYGRPLVTNRITRAIRLDSAKLRVADQAASDPGAGSRGITELLELCRESGVAHTDEFPVTLYPYRYVSDITAQQTKRLRDFCKKCEIDPDLTAEGLMDALRLRYRVDGRLSEDDARAVIGVRYEAELREHFYGVPPYAFASDIPVSLYAEIRERGLAGVSVITEAAREYETDYAAHLLGRVGPIFEEQTEEYAAKGYSLGASVGKDGLERAAEDWLRGTDGVLRIEKNFDAQITDRTYLKEPVAGSHVTSTLDIRFQEAAERALERGIYDLRSRTKNPGDEPTAGASVVIDVKTGEVLAMATYPSYKPQDFSRMYAAMLEDPDKPLLNRAIQGAYEPGSTFKMCTGLAALESGVLGPKQTIQDKGRYMYYAPSYTPACLIYSSSGGTHGFINISQALKVSCNYFFYEAGRLTTIGVMNEYAKNFGLGQPSGIELFWAENKGTLAGPEYAAANNLAFNPGDTIQAAIGQSYNTFTPLQMAVYVSAIANGGTHWRPHLIKSVMSYDYTKTALDILPEAIHEFGFKPENIAAVQEGMRMGTQPGGTSYSVFKNFRVNVAVKTGTAQVSKGRPDNGVYVAYAPYEEPEVAIALVIEKGAGGSRVAFIARDILDAYFDIKQQITEGGS